MTRRWFESLDHEQDEKRPGLGDEGTWSGRSKKVMRRHVGSGSRVCWCPAFFFDLSSLPRAWNKLSPSHESVRDACSEIWTTHNLKHTLKQTDYNGLKWFYFKDCIHKCHWMLSPILIDSFVDYGSRFHIIHSFMWAKLYKQLYELFCAVILCYFQ